MNTVNPRNKKQLEQFTLKLMMDGKGVKVSQVSSDLGISEEQATKVMRGLWRKALVKPFFHDQKGFTKFNSNQVLAVSTWTSSKLRPSSRRAPAQAPLNPKYSVQTFFKNRGGDAPGNGQFKGKSKEKKRQDAMNKLGKGDEGRKQPIIEKVRVGSAPGAQTRGPQPQRPAPTNSR